MPATDRHRTDAPRLTGAPDLPVASVKPGPILAIILVSYFMILLDNSVIFTGLPSVRSRPVSTSKSSVSPGSIL